MVARLPVSIDAPAGSGSAAALIACVAGKFCTCVCAPPSALIAGCKAEVDAPVGKGSEALDTGCVPWKNTPVTATTGAVPILTVGVAAYAGSVPVMPNPALPIDPPAWNGAPSVVLTMATPAAVDAPVGKGNAAALTGCVTADPSTGTRPATSAGMRARRAVQLPSPRLTKASALNTPVSVVATASD